MSNRLSRSDLLVKRLLLEDESAFVCFYISTHYNALRLPSAPLPDATDDDNEAYLERVRSMLSDLQIDVHYYTTTSQLAWKCAKLMSRHIKVGFWEEESKTGRRLEKDVAKGKVQLVTGKKFVLSLDDGRSRMFKIVPKGNIPFETIAMTYRAYPNNRTMSCQVWGDINDSSNATTKQVEPVLTYQIDFGDDILDHRVDLPNEVYRHNGRNIKLLNKISFRAQMKIDCTLQLAPTFWVIKIPCLLLKRSVEPCCDPHGHKLTGCVRSNSIESHWKQVLGPIFIDSAGRWTEEPKLIQPVMVSLSRLSFQLPPCPEIQKELSTILVSYVQATGEDLSSELRNDYCLDQPEMVELVTRNLLAYDAYLDVPDKITILEWICDQLRMVNLGSVYFTASLLQYLHYLVHGIDSHSRLSINDVDLLCKVAKVAHWIHKMLDDADQKDLKQLVVDEQEVEEEDWSDEEEELEEEMSDSDESHSEMSELSQETQTELQEETTINSNANESNQSVEQTKHDKVRPFSATGHLRAMARKLNHKCGQLLDELNDNDDH